MERKTLGILSAFAMIAILGVSLVSAFGFGSVMSSEDKTAMRDAIESGDYAAWKALMESQINEETFNELKSKHAEMEEFRTQMQAAREAGDTEKIEALKAEFGKGMGEGNIKGKGQGMGKMHNLEDGECPFAD